MYDIRYFLLSNILLHYEIFILSFYPNSNSHWYFCCLFFLSEVSCCCMCAVRLSRPLLPLTTVHWAFLDVCFSICFSFLFSADLWVIVWISFHSRFSKRSIVFCKHINKKFVSECICDIYKLKCTIFKDLL